MLMILFKWLTHITYEPNEKKNIIVYYCYVENNIVIAFIIAPNISHIIATKD
jgi:hypothetical protein